MHPVAFHVRSDSVNHANRILVVLIAILRAVAHANPEAHPKDPIDCSKQPPKLLKTDPEAHASSWTTWWTGEDTTDKAYGDVHDIVGKDGAFLLTVLRSPERFQYSAGKLREAGIIATQFPAADGFCDSETDTERGCFLQGDPKKNETIVDECRAKQGWGWGCDTMPTAACAESHHRALQAAQYRKHDWTLIMEDDAVPLDAPKWQENFKEVWQKIPDSAKLVRLGWCTFPMSTEKPMVPLQPRNIPEVDDKATGKFKIIRNITSAAYPWNYEAGLCTTAYMVHRDAIDDMLGIFPCCCSFDCCMGQSLINLPTNSTKHIGQTWGQTHMVSIDMSNSTESTIGWNKHKYMYQYGAIVQDNRNLDTLRQLQKATDMQSSDMEQNTLQFDDLASELSALMYMLHS